MNETGESGRFREEPDISFGPVSLDHVAAGVYSIDSAGFCTHVNAAAMRMLGMSEADCLGRDMHQLIHYKRPDGSPYPPEECPLVATRLRGTPIYNIDETVWRRSGEPVRVACSSVPLFVSDRLEGAVITMNDLSALRQIEDKIQILEEEQREALRQRDAAARVETDMANEQAMRHRENAVTVERVAAEQLREQQRMAEERLVQSEKLAAVGRLAASISHEINNPLEAITNLLYLVRSDPSLSDEACEYLNLAEQELARVSEIVSQTLRFQRGTGAPTTCQPEGLIESVISLHQGRLHNSHIRIDRQHRRSRGMICAEGDVRQILNNLVSNAVDAMRETGGVITIRTQPARDPVTGNEGFRISVSDTGHGMSGSTAAQVFEPFYTTKGSGGSGLGLWISSTLAKRHGGKLSVRSRTGEKKQRGTTFSLFLPHADVSASETADGRRAA